jgi:hypothetical protein
MKRRLWILALAGALLASAAPVLAQDGFYVVPTRVVPGTCIASLPYTITAPGDYFLNRNLTYTGGNGITVDADNVTLDLMGFCLTGPSNNSNTGIFIKESRHNVEVRNGTLSGWLFGVETGSSATGNGHRVIGVRAVGNTYGVLLSGSGTGHLIKGCTAVAGNLGAGRGLTIEGSGTITGCTVMNFDPQYIGALSIGAGGTISDNVVLNCIGDGGGIEANGNTTVRHNAVINCSTGMKMHGGSLIGNAVFATTGQTALKFDGTPVVADQNSFDLGSGANYYTGTWAGTWGVNGGATPTAP